MDLLPYGRHVIDAADIEAVTDVLRGDWLTTGPAVERFEDALCTATSAPHAVAVSNGTAALFLAYSAFGIGEGDFVIVPAITFVATANAARMAGAEVIFADVDPHTGNMTLETLEAAYASAPDRVKAVSVVHMAGQPVDLEPISAFCKAHSLLLIEDACHAIGSTYKGSSIGDCTYSDAACFSFHPVKTIAMGEGGAITTSSAEIADRIRTLRHHGLIAPDAGDVEGFDAETGTANSWYRQMPELGYNFRACDIQCALGASQLAKLEDFKATRAALYARYLENGVTLNPVVVDADICWHLVAARLDFETLGRSRQSLMDGLKGRGIGSQVHYVPVPHQPYYRKRYGTLEMPGAWAYYRCTLSLPLFVTMTENDVDKVCDALHAELGEKGMQQCA